MSFVLEHMNSNLWRGRFTHFPSDVLEHGISARLGGVSVAPYSALNMGLHVGDEPEKVIENRRRFLHALELKAEDACSPHQVHGTKVLRVTWEDRGRGALDYGTAIAGTDALITNALGVPLLLCFADCVPLMFFDPEHGAIGVAHAGWKGTVGRIGEKTVQAMAAEFGTEPGKLLVGIGPSIGPDCFTVGEEVAEKFREAFPDYYGQILSQGEDGLHADLWAANRLQLEEAGVAPANIECANACTSCEHKWYFSYRADGGDTGRLAAVMALKKY